MDRFREIFGLLMEYQRYNAIGGVTFLSARFINEFAQFVIDKPSLKMKAPGDAPGHLVEAKPPMILYHRNYSHSIVAGGLDVMS